jgi:predicted  nucleic acid-binding Zn-ribbon protein
MMKCMMAVKVGALAATAGLAGCADVTPLVSDVADLKQQVAKLQSDVATARAQAGQPSSDSAEIASLRQQVARLQSEIQSARALAGQASNAAQTAQSTVDSTNEKIDRMFKRGTAQ